MGTKVNWNIPPFPFAGGPMTGGSGLVTVRDAWKLLVPPRVLVTDTEYIPAWLARKFVNVRLAFVANWMGVFVL